MKVAFKLPHGLASHLVNQRELRTVYQTNRAVKVYGFFALLKTITESGVIKNYHSQITDIGTLTKKSRTGVYTYISQCKTIGLLKVNGGNLYLNSWQDAVNTVDCAYYSGLYTTLQYDTTHDKQTPEYLIYAAEIKENQDRQTLAVIKQIENNLPLANTLGVGQNVQPKHVMELHKLQVFTFVNGKSENDYSLIHSCRADVQRTAKTLRKTYGMKDRRSVKYLKMQLAIRGIATIAKRVLESDCRNRVNKNLYYTGYIKETQKTFWKQPDLIQLQVA